MGPQRSDLRTPDTEITIRKNYNNSTSRWIFINIAPECER